MSRGVYAWYNGRRVAGLGAIALITIREPVMKFSRQWHMPNPDTFSIKPIADLLNRWLVECEVIVDPFARNSKFATHTNDLGPEFDVDHECPFFDSKEACWARWDREFGKDTLRGEEQ